MAGLIVTRVLTEHFERVTLALRIIRGALGSARATAPVLAPRAARVSESVAE